MKSKKILASLLTLSMMASISLVGCGKEKAKETTADGGKGEAVKVGEEKIDADQYLNLLLAAEPKTIDQSKTADASLTLLSNTQEALTRITQDKNGKDKIEPGIAESWEQSKDGLTWTFKLRDAKWNDGKPVTAEQFVNGITRTLEQDTASPYAFLLYPIANATEFNAGKAKVEDLGIKALDDKTLEFKLKSPCPYFLDLTYFRVMQPQRADILEKYGDKYGTEADTMVYCGPFTIGEWAHNNKIELVKNPEYWDAGKVKLEKVTMKIIKESSSAMNELYNASLDVAGVSKPEWIEKLDATGEFDVRKGYSASTTYTFFNQETKLFSNAKVRKAFIIAESREEKIKTLRKGLGEPALSLCPPSVQIGGEDYREKVKDLPVQALIDENPDPKELFIEGMKELGLGEDPSTITIKYLQSATDSSAKEFAEFQQQLYKSTFGINVDIDYADWAVFNTRTSEMDYEVASSGWTGDYNDPNTFLDYWISTSSMVPTGWKSEKYDNLIAKASESIDPNERAEIFKQAERLLIYEQGVISPETWRIKNTYVRKYVKGYSSPLFGGEDLKYVYTSGR